MAAALADAPVPTGLEAEPSYLPPPSLHSCIVDAKMLRPALKPQIDVDATRANIAATVAAFGNPPKGWRPDLSHVALKPGTACYALELTLNTAAYDLEGVALTDGKAADRTVPNWFAECLASAGVPLLHERDRAIRLWGLYAPALQALAAKLRSTVALLLAHENLDAMEIRSSVAPGDAERRVPQLASWVENGDGSSEVAAAKQDAASARAAAADEYVARPPKLDAKAVADAGVSSLTLTFSIDPRTSHMLRLRFDECERCDTLPYGLEDMLWGTTLAELFWLGGAAMQDDERRREGVRSDCEYLSDTATLDLPYAPPHQASSCRDNANGQQCVVWRMAATPEQT